MSLSLVKTNQPSVTKLIFRPSLKGRVFARPVKRLCFLALAGYSTRRRVLVPAAFEATVPVHPSFASLVTANPRNSDTLGSPASTMRRTHGQPRSALPDAVVCGMAESYTVWCLCKPNGVIYLHYFSNQGKTLMRTGVKKPALGGLVQSSQIFKTD